MLLFLVSAGMELCYLYAGATFFTELIFHRTFPFPEAVVSFLVAALLTLFSEGRGWRVIFVLGVQALGFIPALFRMVTVFDSWADSFLSQTWLTEAFASPSGAVQYSIFILVILWVLVFWAGGTGLVGRQNDYFTLCSRFDRGLVVFFVLFLTKFYLQAVQGIRSAGSTAGFFVFPFLIFSLLAIGLVRNWSAAQRDFMPGYQTIGILLGFIVVVLLAGTGLVFFFLPYMTSVAQRGSDILTTFTSSLVAAVFAILAWLFGTDFAMQNLPETMPLPNSTANVSFPWWIEFLGRILAGTVAVIVALVVIAILGGMLYSIMLWLFSKTPKGQRKQNPWQLFSLFISQLHAIAIFFWLGLIRQLKGYDQAIHLYAALRDWGRSSGTPHFPSETPTEYGSRLKDRFPILEKEFESIVDAFNREVYGETVLDETQLFLAKSAWRRLASPLRWLMRLKASFHRTPQFSHTSLY